MDSGSLATPARIALINYGAVLLLVAFIGVSLTLRGDGADLVGVKLMAVPLWFVVLGSLNALYRRPLVERRLTTRSLEHTLLHALLFCVVLAIMWWTPEPVLAEILRHLAVLGVFFVPWRLHEIHCRLRETNRRDDA